MKKKAKKKRIKFKSFLILLFVLIVISLLVWYFLSLRIKNIYVLGNNNLKEYEIIEEAGLTNYPQVYKVRSRSIEKTLLQNKLIKNVDVSKTLFGKVTIKIEEEEILFKNNQGYFLENGDIVEIESDVLGIPTLINEITNYDVQDRFIRKFSTIDKEIRRKISEIEYAKTELDDEKFLLYMSDGNYVYITLSKINLINSYNEIYQTLGDNKGILYLDSGNHFQIKEKSN